MGADWVGGVIRLDKTVQEMHAALNELTDSELARLYAKHNGFLWEDEAIGTMTVRDYYTGLIDDFYRVVSFHRRDGLIWRLNGVDFVISGGISWGDAPTDLCQTMWDLTALPFIRTD